MLAGYVISFVLDFCQVCLASMVASYVISFAVDICRVLLHKYVGVHPFFIVIV